MNTEKSTGHKVFIGKYEYFVFANGALYRALKSNPVMPDGYRGGARWQVPYHMIEDYLKQLTCHSLRMSTFEYQCPQSGLATDYVWTNHDLPGVFNSCEHCADISTAPSLQKLEKQRKLEKSA